MGKSKNKTALLRSIFNRSNGEGFTLVELVRKSGISNFNVSVFLSSFYKAGYLDRRGCRRKYVYSLKKHIPEPKPSGRKKNKYFRGTGTIDKIFKFIKSKELNSFTAKDVFEGTGVCKRTIYGYLNDLIFKKKLTREKINSIYFYSEVAGVLDYFDRIPVGMLSDVVWEVIILNSNVFSRGEVHLEVERILERNVSKNSVNCVLYRWYKAGCLVRVSKGRYKLESNLVQRPITRV